MFRFAFSIFLVAFCYSCESPVDLDALAVKPTLSASSTFSFDTPFEVYLSQGRAITSNHDFEMIDNALVEIYDRDGFLVEQLANQGQGVYAGNTPVEMDTFYALRVEHPDFPEPLIGSSFIPEPAELGSTTPSPETGAASPIQPNVSIRTMDLEIEVKDPPGKNYYHVLFEYNLVDFTVEGLDTILNWENSELNIPFFDLDGNNFEYAILNNSMNPLNGAFLDDKDFKAVNQKLTFTLQYPLDPSREIAENMRVEVRTITKEYYDFYTSAIQNADTGANPFSNDPADIKSNIENGFGLFAGYSHKAKSVKIPR